MSSEDPIPSHIPASVLWEYSRRSIDLAEAHLEHLKLCERCVGVLGLCRVSNSVKHLEERLKNENIE